MAGGRSRGAKGVEIGKRARGAWRGARGAGRDLPVPGLPGRGLGNGRKSKEQVAEDRGYILEERDAVKGLKERGDTITCACRSDHPGGRSPRAEDGSESGFAPSSRSVPLPTEEEES